jgi:hypothetical protein
MTDLHLDATSRTPAITLDRSAGMLAIAGESYPEDVTSFYAMLTTALTDYFAGGGAGADTAIASRTDVTISVMKAPGTPCLVQSKNTR